MQPQAHHICSFGFNEIWPQNEIAFLETLNEKSLIQVRKKNFINEIYDLQETIDNLKKKIREAKKEHHPKWLIILVTKADLYWDNIEIARNHYHPLDEKFKKQPHNLKHPKLEYPNQILKKFVRELPDIELSILPVALNQHDYCINSIEMDITKKSQLDEKQRIALNSVFFENLRRHLNVL